MIFGEISIEEADGAILAHATRQGDLDLKKGATLAFEDIEALRAAGVLRVVVARLEEGDLTEDEAASRIADALTCAHLNAGRAATGRVNIYATCSGIFRPDRGIIDALNAVDPGITLATLAEGAPVREGQMVATIKIIPLAVSGTSIDQAVDVLSQAAAIGLHPFAAWNVTLIQTVLPKTSSKMLDKTAHVTRDRLAISGSKITDEIRVPHRVDDLADAIANGAESDLILIFGASAVIDRRDVIPGAIECAGGAIEYFGMPVDPGNLLLFGHYKGKPIIGAPGCARSPKENGFDWVLDRLLAGETVTPKTLQGFGVGGLLAEIETRPRPRQVSRNRTTPTVDIVVLAAGRSTRMAPANKLLSDIRPGVSLVRHAVTTALGSREAGKVRVVLGHREAEVRDALSSLSYEPISNPHFADGLSSSLKAGFEAATEADGVLVMLADQPFLTSDDLDRLIAEFTRHEGRFVVAAADGEKRRNPVIIPRRFSEDVAMLTGDTGAAPFLAQISEQIRVVDLGERASRDTDTPEQLEDAKTQLAACDR